MPDGRTISLVNEPLPSGGWVATHQDITEEQRREASFRLLFESSPVPMWVWDHETLRFLAVNDAAIVHYGYGRERFLAMTVPDIRRFETEFSVADAVSNDGARLRERVRLAPRHGRRDADRRRDLQPPDALRGPRRLARRHHRHDGSASAPRASCATRRTSSRP